MKAVCQRCGGGRESFDQICPSCGHRPEGEGLLVAWLLSDRNLDEAALGAAGRRIAAGEPLRPSSRQLARAKTALGRDYHSDPGLTVGQRLGLLATSVFLTPLVGLAAWLWWRNSRPRASIQALALSLPLTLIYTVLFPMVFWLRA